MPGPLKEFMTVISEVQEPTAEEVKAHEIKIAEELKVAEEKLEQERKAEEEKKRKEEEEIERKLNEE